MPAPAIKVSSSRGLQMEAKIPVDLLQEDPQARRDRVLEAIRRYRPMSVWGQLIVLLFVAAMILLMALLSELRHAPNPTLALSGSFLIAIFFVAANAMRTQRQLNAMVEVVMQGFGKS
jgi:hypothetical protein